MADEHQPAIPLAIEQVVSRLSELAVVLGEVATPALAAVERQLLEAMAARDRGDMPAAIGDIGRAMDTLAALADRLDPAEALLMRTLAERFRSALVRGDQSSAKQVAATMFDRSGARERKPS
jgi:hypothetical protein